MVRAALSKVAFALLTATLGFGGAGDHSNATLASTPSGDTPIGSPKGIASSEFTYPAQGQASYQRAVTRYFQKAGLPIPNKHQMIKKHLELATTHYATHIQGSKVRIFHPNKLADTTLLQTVLPELLAKPVGDVTAEQTLALGNITYHLKGRPFPYGPDEAYVDFANRMIGGGVLGSGFVQEEILILETNLLPWVAAVRDNQHKGTHFALAISLKNLDEQPVVLHCRRFLEVAHQDEIYGGKLTGRQPFDPARYLQALPKPIDLYLIAMAAKPCQAGTTYTENDIAAMTLVATRGFHDALMAQHTDGKPLVVHPGNWGAGAFGNTPRTMWAIQMAALEAAHALVCQATGTTPKVAFHGYAYDATGVKDDNVTHNEFVTFPAYRPAGEYANLIFKSDSKRPRLEGSLAIRSWRH